MRGPYIIEFRAEFSSIEGAFTTHELTLMMNSCASIHAGMCMHAYMHALEHIILCVCISIYVYIYYVQTHFMVLSFSHTRIRRQLNVNSS